MKDFKLLKFLDKFQEIFEKQGIQYDMMRKILFVKLTMDGRRESTVINQNNSKKNNQDGNKFYKSLWVYALLGLFFIIFLLMGNHYIVQMSLVFGVSMFMTMTSLISDFSNVLLDIRDKGIILTRPINEKTLSMAKAIHILNYIITINLALLGPSLIASIFLKGVPFFILYLVEAILMNFFIVALTALVYLFVLRFFDGEKLRDIINYVQIALSIVMIIGYQFIGRLYEFIYISKSTEIVWFQYIIPPVWFSAPFEFLLNGNRSIGIIILSLFAIVVPVASIMCYIKLMPAFEKNLQKLSQVSENTKVKKGITLRFTNFLCRENTEKVFYKFATNLMSSEREFKLKLYPSLGFAIVFPFIMLFSMYSNNFTEIESSKSYLTIYLSIAYSAIGINLLNCSANYRGAWIYEAIPIKKLGYASRGVLKAFIIKYIMPLFLVQSIIYIFIYGFKILPDLLGVLFASLFLIVIIYKIIAKELPFSISFNDVGKESVVVMLCLLLILGIVWALHYGLTFIVAGNYIYIVLMIMTNIVIWKKAFKL